MSDALDVERLRSAIGLAEESGLDDLSDAYWVIVNRAYTQRVNDGPASPNPARSEPTTAEGRALVYVEDWPHDALVTRNGVAAIEAAAAEAERARIRARLEALPVMLMEDEERDMDMIVLGRAAVLAAIDDEAKG